MACKKCNKKINGHWNLHINFETNGWRDSETARKVNNFLKPYRHEDGEYADGDLCCEWMLGTDKVEAKRVENLIKKKFKGKFDEIYLELFEDVYEEEDQISDSIAALPDWMKPYKNVLSLLCGDEDELKQEKEFLTKLKKQGFLKKVA